MKRLLLATLLAFTPVAASANPNTTDTSTSAAATAPAPAPLADADPALWVVRDDDTIIYLFGTVHMLDGRPWFNDEVKTAFDASNELVLEAVLPENPAAMVPLLQRYAMFSDGRTLSGLLSPEQRSTVEAALRPMGVPLTAFDRMEPWAVSMMLTALSAQRLGLSGDQGAEQILTRAARERGITVGELEGNERQLAILDGIPEASQLRMLVETAEQQADVGAFLQRMLTSWANGDEQGLAELMNESLAEDEALARILLTDRNARWAEWIAQRMQRPGIVFVAVGAGHLGGEGSVQAQLATRGLRSARVPAPASGTGN
ncbi:MAG: TraB/GumN family protein [Sphingosinicella sp.]